MISIDLGTIEYYDGIENKFTHEHGGIVRFEYSLKAVYDWEGKWHKSFLKGEFTNEELIDFYMTMAIDPVESKFITYDVMVKLREYIGSPNSATTFTTHDSGQNGNKRARSGKVDTAEEIYALMFEAGIDLEFENRNLNRLMNILKIISLHNSPAKKMSKDEIFKQNARLNAQRKAQMKTKG